jgi:hypothetical protein
MTVMRLAGKTTVLSSVSGASKQARRTADRLFLSISGSFISTRDSSFGRPSAKMYCEAAESQSVGG